ncbi:hypothetical protein [Parachitinimonas caeni]|uniref:RCK C-terminal domain-containing protein n=1 Tax=Parachitinimonas caeni TaxID=3031301 RepID=A0ABT7DXH3_9NEIS|nr:hypothetical protein [Parachitinimonas caeni]MDK2124736.1 hypothetical protein [Parachitinimonas caeni]
MAYQCECGKALDLAEQLDSLPTEACGQSGHLCTRCLQCGQSIEIQLHTGQYEVGYSYWAGSMHFDPVHSVTVHGLKIVGAEPDGLEVSLGERRWQFGISTPSRQRYILFENAFASDKCLAELDFEQWQVRVEAVERAGTRHPPTADFRLQAGDFLHLCGPAPALVRAWHYLNDGKSARPR